MKFFKKYIFPKIDKETKNEIYTINIRTIRYLSLLVGIVQLISIVVFLIANKGFSDRAAFNAFARVGLSVVMCLAGVIISTQIMKNPDVIKDRQTAVRIFIYVFIVLFIVWGIIASVNSYINYQQIITFYTVELVMILFMKLHPLFSTTVIVTSYLATFFIFNFVYIEGLINPYNYILLMLLSALGSIVNFHLTVGYISEKNKANMLNDSLEIIANHDSTTRLLNRYALNQSVPEFLDTDICVAMGDINNFKMVNDTYGHTVGDDVLKLFADILLETFAEKCIFRYGGDEFIVIQEGSDIDSLREKLGEVNKVFASHKIENCQTDLSCSFGCVTAHPISPSDFFTVMTRADLVLYEEKAKFKANKK